MIPNLGIHHPQLSRSLDWKLADDATSTHHHWTHGNLQDQKENNRFSIHEHSALVSKKGANRRFAREDKLRVSCFIGLVTFQGDSSDFRNVTHDRIRPPVYVVHTRF